MHERLYVPILSDGLGNEKLQRTFFRRHMLRYFFSIAWFASSCCCCASHGLVLE